MLGNVRMDIGIKAAAKIAAGALLAAVSAEIVYVDQHEQHWFVEPLRKIMSNRGVPFNADAFSKHGCWCSSERAGRSASEMDSLCHQLNQCLKCVELESLCATDSHFWTMNILNSTSGHEFVSCPGNSETRCGQMKCECAEATLSTIATYLEHNPNAENVPTECEFPFPKSPNNNSKVIKPIFQDLTMELIEETPDVLLKSGIGNAKNDACCGVHPHWFPFNSQNGERACCNGKTYNKNALKCCENKGLITGISVSCYAEESGIQDDFTVDSDSFNENVVVLPDCGAEQEVVKSAESQYACENLDSCRSTSSCATYTVPSCGDSERLVGYQVDTCCSYFYCAPFAGECDNVVCPTSEKCSEYQVATTALNEFSECCPTTQCICDYNLCDHEKPECEKDEKLVATHSADGCCSRYTCELQVQVSFLDE